MNPEKDCYCYIILTVQSCVCASLSDLLAFLQESQQGCIVGPLLFFRPSRLQQLLLNLLLTVLVGAVRCGPGPLQRSLH